MTDKERKKQREDLRLKMRIAMRVTYGFAIVMVISIAAELLLIAFGVDALWAKKLLRLFGALALASPFGVLVPLFFRVNYQSRLVMLRREEKEEIEKKKKDDTESEGV